MQDYIVFGLILNYIYMYVHAGYWSGKMVSATLLPHQHLKLIQAIILPYQFMGTMNASPTKGSNLSFSSRCHMKSITMEKGMHINYNSKVYPILILSGIWCLNFCSFEICDSKQRGSVIYIEMLYTYNV